MRSCVVAAALLLTPSLSFAQTTAPTFSREPLRAQLIAQAREARGRQDYGACASYLDAATAIRADTLVRYSAALCAMQGGLLPEARRFAHACLHETEGDPEHLRNCQRLLGELDALEAQPTRAPVAPVAAQPPRAAVAGRAPQQPPATPQPPARSAEGRGVPAGAIVLWAAGGASLALAGVGLALHGESSSACAVQGEVAICPDAAAAARAGDAGTWAAVANASFAVGLAALAGGTVWWLVDRGRPRPVRVTVGLGSIGLAGTF